MEKTFLRELLKADFGIDLPISGGSGCSLAEPVIIDSDSPHVMSRVQMEMLRCILMRLGWHWRLSSKELVGPQTEVIEKVVCEVKYTEEEQVITEIRAFYFDISKLGDEAKKGTPPCNIDLGDAYQIGLPYQLGWLHFSGITNHEQQSPGMGLSMAYGAPFTKVTIYAYNKSHPVIDWENTPEIFDAEFDQAIKDFLTMNPSSEVLADYREDNLIFRSFQTGSAYAVVILSTVKNLFFKLRITMDGTNDRYPFDCLMESLSYINSVFQPREQVH